MEAGASFQPGLGPGGWGWGGGRAGRVGVAGGVSVCLRALSVCVCVCVRAHTMIMDSYNKKCGLHVAYNCSRWLEAHTLMHSDDVLWASIVANVHTPRVGCAVRAMPGGVEKEITRGCEREKGRQREGGGGGG